MIPVHMMRMVSLHKMQGCGFTSDGLLLSLMYRRLRLAGGLLNLARCTERTVTISSSRSIYCRISQRWTETGRKGEMTESEGRGRDAEGGRPAEAERD